MKLLMIAYIFPPLAGAGVYRTLKLVKYLPGEGVQPVVVSADDPNWYMHDTNGELAADVPGVTEVHRVRPRATLEHIKAAYRLVSGSKPPGPGARQPADAAAAPSAPRLRRRVLDALRMPDEQIYWVAPAVREASRVLRGGGIDCIYSSAPPFSTHLVAEALKRRHPSVPWIADFRDAWAGNPVYMAALTPSQRRAHLERERRVVEAADIVIGVAPGIVDHFLQTYPQQAHKVRLLPNGFDPDDFAGVVAGPPPDVFTLAHVGELSETRDPSPLIRAVAHVRQAESDIRLRMRFVGYVDPGLRVALEELRRQLGLEDVVSFEDPVAHSEAIRVMASAHVLVFQSAFRSVDPLVGQTYPGKLFEYFAAGRPVLGIVPEGPAAALIRETGAGWTYPPEDEAGLAACLESLIGKWRRAEPLLASPPRITAFDRRRIAAELAGMVSELVRGENER